MELTMGKKRIAIAHDAQVDRLELARVKRDGTCVPLLHDRLWDARQFAFRLAWENRPSKFAFFAVRTPTRVRYGIHVLRAPGIVEES